MDGWVSERLSTRDDSAVSFATLLPSRPLSSSLLSLPVLPLRCEDNWNPAPGHRQEGITSSQIKSGKQVWTERLDRQALSSWIMNLILSLDYSGIILILLRGINMDKLPCFGGIHISKNSWAWEVADVTLLVKKEIFASNLSCHLGYVLLNCFRLTQLRLLSGKLGSLEVVWSVCLMPPLFFYHILRLWANLQIIEMYVANFFHILGATHVSILLKTVAFV